MFFTIEQRNILPRYINIKPEVILVKNLKIFWIIFLLISPLTASNSNACHPLDINDITHWKSIKRHDISADGNWFAWSVAGRETNSTVFVKNIKTDSLYSFHTGFNRSIKPEFCSDYLLFPIYPDKATVEQSKKNKEPIQKDLGIVTLKTGNVKKIKNYQSVKFPEEPNHWIAIKSKIPKSRTDKKDWTGSDLLLYNLLDSSYISFGNVSEFEFDKDGDWLAMLIDTKDNSGNCVLLRNMKSGNVISLVSDRKNFKHLNWAEEADALSFLELTPEENYKTNQVKLFAFKDLKNNSIEKLIIDPKKCEQFPQNMSISPNYKPRWKEELDGLFFGIHEKELSEEAKQDSLSKNSNEELPEMVIWHWKDKRLQSRQWLQKNRDKNFSYLSYFDIKARKFHQLANDTIRTFIPAKRGDFAVGYSKTNYKLTASLEGRQFQDIYTYDLESGVRNLALKKIRWYFGQSPDHEFFYYYRKGNFFAYDIANKKSINLTQNIPTSFIDEEDDHNVKNPPDSPIGWSEDSRYLVLSDGWDLWKVKRNGRKFYNLTKDGKDKQIVYGRYYRIDQEDEGINFSEDVFIRLYGKFNKKHGIGKIPKGKEKIVPIFFSDHSYRFLTKAKDADRYYFTREDYNSYPDYYTTDGNFDDLVNITKIENKQEEICWCSGRKILSYTTEYGDTLQGVLYLPANYEKDKKYPTIVYMYEKLSHRANQYLLPRLAGILNTAYYTSHGYAIFKPDITFKLNDPGLSSVACITAGVKAAIATGIVDEQRLGIQGHSWGGYQTAFAITQTDMFKAAVAGAPLTNMLSMYSSIYWNTGGANMAIFESSQGRFLGGYWDNIEAYTRNSPVYFADQVNTPLLMLHNDKDGAVDWNQGIEYYNTLRRLQKPVVMLEYKGENHGLRQLENRKDYTLRMKEFFDHYLKENPAPDWWKTGVKYIDLESHLKNRQKLLLPDSTDTSDTTKTES